MIFCAFRNVIFLHIVSCYLASISFSNKAHCYDTNIIENNKRKNIFIRYSRKIKNWNWYKNANCKKNTEHLCHLYYCHDSKFQYFHFQYNWYVIILDRSLWGTRTFPRNISSETEIDGRKRKPRTYLRDVKIHHAITRSLSSSSIRCEIRK